MQARKCRSAGGVLRHQIAALIDAARGPRFFDHDERGRLVRERRPGESPVLGEQVLHRAMDAVGNIFRHPDLSDRRYGPGGRLEAADGVRYEHDEDGNLTRKVEPDGSGWSYHWNGAGMLREVERPDGQRVRFGYDPFARRTRKTVVRLNPDGTETLESETRFVWDGNTVLHELSADAGLTTWYWEPGTFTPVAKEQGGKQWNIASDHLGTPTEMYDEAGELVWEMRLDSVGTPNISKGQAEECPWRWPGQYEDGEVGLNYNRFRYYDVESERYGSRDPIGLKGGIQLFSYVPDPTLWIDPLGLARCDGTGTVAGGADARHVWTATDDGVVLPPGTDIDLVPTSTPDVRNPQWIAVHSSHPHQDDVRAHAHGPEPGTGRRVDVPLADAMRRADSGLRSGELRPRRTRVDRGGS